MGRAKYTRVRAKFQGGAPSASHLLEISRARVYFARPTIANAKISDYSQSYEKLVSIDYFQTNSGIGSNIGQYRLTPSTVFTLLLVWLAAVILRQLVGYRKTSVV